MSIPITITGRIGVIDPLTVTKSGHPRLSIRLVTSKRIKDKETGRWTDSDPTWINATAWRDLAEAIALSCITKGTEVIATGELAERRYTTRDGSERTTLELTIRALAPTITTRQSVTVNRATTSSSQPTDDDPWQVTP